MGSRRVVLIGEAPADLGAVHQDLAMFQAFEPAAPVPGTGPVVITVGQRSPPIRHDSVRRLREEFGLPVWQLPGSRHAVHLGQPVVFADAIRQLAVSARARA